MTKKIYLFIKKTFFIWLCIVSLSGLYVVSTISTVIVSGQEIFVELTPSPTPPTIEQSEDSRDLIALKEAALKKMSEYPELIKEGYKPFEVGNTKVRKGWASLNLLSYPENPQKDIHVIVPELYLAIGEKDTNGFWTVYIENEREYSEILQETPDELFSPRVKRGLRSKYEKEIESVQLLLTARISDEYHVPGLPYAAGESWEYTNGPHDGYGTNTALDFATPEGTSDTVRAAEDGVVVEAKQTCLRVRRYNSNLEFLYQHIDPDDIDNWSIDDGIDLGASIGDTTTTTGCGGPAYGHHVHIEMLYSDLEGKSYNGWVINGDNLVKEGITRQPNGSAVLHDDWVIANGSGYIISFPGEAQIPRNVIVRNDSILEVGNNARLNINYVNYTLNVESGSGVIIRSGGGV